MKTINRKFWTILMTAIVFLVFLSVDMMAQGRREFGVRYATIYIRGEMDNNALVAISNHLLLDLNYETGELIMKLDKSSLQTGVKALDEQLATMQNDFIQFNGFIDTRYISNDKHPTLNVKVFGKLKSGNQSQDIEGVAEIDYIFSGLYSNRLQMKFYLNLKDLGLEVEQYGIKNEIEVEIIEILMNKEL